MITRLQHIGLAVENLEASQIAGTSFWGFALVNCAVTKGKDSSLTAYYVPKSMLAARGAELESRVQGEPLPSQPW